MRAAAARSPLHNRWLGPAAVVILVFLYAPLLIVVIYAFNGGRNLSWPPQGASVRWFRDIFGDDAFRSALWTSVVTAAGAAILATAVGTTAAVVLTRHRGRLVQTAQGLSVLPVLLPPLLIGVGLATAMNLTGVPPGRGPIILGQAVLALPFVVIIVSAGLRGYDTEVESAARDLGARPAQVVRRVLLPIIAPSVLGASLLAFASSFDEVLVTTFTSGTTTTVPLYILGKLRRNIDPGVNSVATILLLIPWFALLAGALVFRRSRARVSTIEKGAVR